MTSEERREGRYQRRQAARRRRREARCEALGSLEDVFSYRRMFFYGKKCCNGVRWKQSTQNFELHLFSGTAVRRRKILRRQYRAKRCIHFIIQERGKTRPIDAPHITDRQIHKLFCNEVLIPLYTPAMIHDNGASRKGMGLHYQYRRLADQLRWHYRRYGRTGGVATLDLKQFFPGAPRWVIFQRHARYITNGDLRQLADRIVDQAPATAPGRGMPLGLEPSQQEMVSLPSSVDNWLKCQVGAHCAGHYMDDYVIIMPDVERLKAVVREMVRRFEAMGIRVNKRKCKITPLTEPFRFCKARFTLTESGRVIINGSRDGIKRARRKLKMFHREVEAGRRSLAGVHDFMNSHEAYYRNFNDHGRLLRLRRLHHAIFGGASCTELSKTA